MKIQKYILILLLTLNISIISAQQEKSFIIESENYQWLYEDLLEGPVLKHRGSFVQGDSIAVKFQNISFDPESSELELKGDLYSPISAWYEQAVIIAGIRMDTITQIGFVDDHSGVYKEDIEIIKLITFDLCRFKSIEESSVKRYSFNCKLEISDEYDLLVVALNDCYGILIDLKKMIKEYRR